MMPKEPQQRMPVKSPGLKFWESLTSQLLPLSHTVLIKLALKSTWSSLISEVVRLMFPLWPSLTACLKSSLLLEIRISVVRISIKSSLSTFWKCSRRSIQIQIFQRTQEPFKSLSLKSRRPRETYPVLPPSKSPSRVSSMALTSVRLSLGLSSRNFVEKSSRRLLSQLQMFSSKRIWRKLKLTRLYLSVVLQEFLRFNNCSLITLTVKN